MGDSLACFIFLTLFAMFYLYLENTSANKINPIDLAGRDIEDIFCGKVAQLLVVRRSDMPQFNIGTDPPVRSCEGLSFKSSKQLQVS